MSRRILIDARSLDGTPSGVATYSRNLVEHLLAIDSNNRYTVLVRRAIKGQLPEADNLEILTWPAAPFSWQTLVRLHEPLNAFAPDVVHFLQPVVPLFYRKPVVISVHDVQPLIRTVRATGHWSPVASAVGLAHRRLLPLAFARSRYVVCPSNWLRDLVVRLFPALAAKTIVVRPGLEANAHAPVDAERVVAVRQKHRLEDPYFLYFGAARPNRNIDTLVKAFARLPARVHGAAPHLVLVVRNDGYRRDVLASIAAIKGAGERVRLLGSLEAPELRALLAGATALAFPCRHEGFAFPPLEAMALGVPVVAARSGALPEVLGNAAVFFEPEDPDDLAGHLEQLMSDAELRRVLSERGLERAGDFDWADHASFLRDIYEDLC